MKTAGPHTPFIGQTLTVTVNVMASDVVTVSATVTVTVTVTVNVMASDVVTASATVTVTVTVGA